MVLYLWQCDGLSKHRSLDDLYKLDLTGQSWKNIQHSLQMLLKQCKVTFATKLSLGEMMNRHIRAETLDEQLFAFSQAKQFFLQIISCFAIVAIPDCQRILYWSIIMLTDVLAGRTEILKTGICKRFVKKLHVQSNMQYARYT